MAFFLIYTNGTHCTVAEPLFPKGERSWCWENCTVITIKALYLHTHQSRWTLTFLIVVFTVQCSSSHHDDCLLAELCVLAVWWAHFSILMLIGYKAAHTQKMWQTPKALYCRQNFLGWQMHWIQCVRWAHKNMLRVQGFRCLELPLLKVLTTYPTGRVHCDH